MRINRNLQIKLFFLLAVTIIILSPHTIISHASENSINGAFSYKNLLSSNQIQVYDQVYSEIESFNENIFTLSVPLTESELEDTMNAVFNDHPEQFWVNTAYRYAVDSMGIVHKIQLKYIIEKSDLESAKVTYNTAINTLVNQANTFKNDIEKERFIYDSICSMNTFDYSCSMSQSAYSALTKGSSVCAGYARAFQVVCQNCGIPCCYVTGTSKGETHAWNIVYIDGNYYNVDLTWDDCITESLGSNSYYYFNKNDQFFASDHLRSPLSSQLVCCTN